MKRTVAVNSNCYHGYSLTDAIAGTTQAGLGYIELTATKGWTEHVFPTFSLRELWSIKDDLTAAGLTPIALSGHTNLMDTARLDDFIANIRLAGFFGCTYIVSSIGEAHLADQAHTDNQEVAHHIHGLLPYLEDADLTLALEVHGDHGSGKILKEIVDLVDSDRVGITYDTANALFYGDVDLVADVAACADRICYMHVKDKAGERTEWNFPALGAGYIDFPALLDVLDRAENPCPLSIEIEFTKDGPSGVEEVDQSVETSAEYLRQLGVLD